MPAKDKSSFYGIFQRILALEDEMTVIATKWKKVESFVHEKNLSSLNSMVEELRLDPCGGQGKGKGRDHAARVPREVCECRICTSPLLQQNSGVARCRVDLVELLSGVWGNVPPEVLVLPLPNDTSSDGSDDVELDFDDKGEGDNCKHGQ
ncbi:hypothetical protein B566_EDAN008472 [Ephemera danica]|nr:hypothetical protein B566_EDAN008472 [Ephemera danica]